MPLSEVPEVRTLAELYRLYPNHPSEAPIRDASAEQQERHRLAWMLGANAVLLTLVRRARDETLDRKILEAWDAEVVEYFLSRAPKPDPA